MFDPRKAGSWFLLLAACAVLAYALSRAGFPAALLLGPMLAGIVFGLRGAALAMPRPLFLAAQAVLGCLVAHALDPEILGTLASDAIPILAAVLVTVAAGALVGLVLTRMQVLPGATAAWGSAPGGAAAMVALSEEYGSDPRLVAVMQYVRVAIVVLTASLAARLLADAAAPAAPPGEAIDPLAVLTTIGIAALGAGLALALRLPSGAMIGPMLLGAGLHAAGLARIALPEALLGAAYAVIGLSVGLRFTRESLRVTLHALPGILAATIAIVLLCGAFAWGLTRLLPIDFLTAFLATSPGGLDAVAIIAVDAKADTSFVLAVQTLRLFTVLLTGPVLARWIARAAPNDRHDA